MAEVDASKLPSLAEHYLLAEKDQKAEMAEKSVEASEVKPSVDTVVEEAVKKVDEILSAVTPADGEGVEATDGGSGESKELAPVDDVADSANSAPVEENSAESENSADQEADESEIKLETAPADFCFPTTNQTRHCFTRYIEYHRCVAAKGEEAPECDKFAKYYRSLCPGEWVDRWNEQRENGTFPGPL